MTATQFRHIKLWFAGKLGNWKLATYELDLLASSLNEAARRAPAGVSADDTVGQVTSLRNAVDAKDLAAFTEHRRGGVPTKIASEPILGAD